MNMITTAKDPMEARFHWEMAVLAAASEVFGPCRCRTPFSLQRLRLWYAELPAERQEALEEKALRLTRGVLAAAAPGAALRSPEVRILREKGGRGHYIAVSEGERTFLFLPSAAGKRARLTLVLLDREKGTLCAAGAEG